MSSLLRSSALSSAEYDDELESLTLTFTNGRSYTFDGVPQDIYDRLLTDPSPGRFYLTYIKDQF
jgi:KTSC domain-containing protein